MQPWRATWTPERFHCGRVADGHECNPGIPCAVDGQTEDVADVCKAAGRRDELIEAEGNGVAEREVFDASKADLLRAAGRVLTGIDSGRPASCQAKRH